MEGAIRLSSVGDGGRHHHCRQGAIVIVVVQKSEEQMPILWRYLFGQYLKVLLFCVFAFVAILLTLRLDEIAHFLALGPETPLILLFVFYQIPYILPIAIPVSCLISAMLLFQRLSNDQELTSLRASGMSLRTILAPLLIASALLSLGNFYLISEVATTSHLQTNVMKNELRSLNPLLVFHNKHLMRMRGMVFDTLGPSIHGQMARDVMIASPDRKHRCIKLLIAKELETKDHRFYGKNVTLLSNLPSGNEPHFLIENIKNTVTPAEDFGQFLHHKVWRVNHDHLRLNLLWARLQNAHNPTPIYAEIMRRISVGIAPFAFTFLGAAFGIRIRRLRSYRALILAISLATLYLVGFFTAKSLDSSLLLSTTLYILPLVVMIAASIGALYRISRGFGG